MKNNFKKNIDKFLHYLEFEKKRSRATVRNYEFYLARFSAWAKKNVRDIELEDIEKYKLWLDRIQEKTKRRLKKNTQNYHLIALREFFKYMSKIDTQILPPEKIKLGKMPERDIIIIDGGELKRFLDAPLNLEGGRDIKNIIILRDKAILETLFSTGLRVSELINLKIKQINVASKKLTVCVKTGKVRTVFISNQAAYWINKYLKKREDLSPFVFVCHDRAKNKRDNLLDPLTSRTVQRIVKKYAKLAGVVKKISPHTLRHSFAANLMANQEDISSVQEKLGHSSLANTRVYEKVK